MPSTPIRIGLIGLARSSGHMSPGLWAQMSHLPYLLASPKYQITALANSKAENAQASIDYHKLGPDVKAYGNPQDIANDPNVDMVVVSVKVQEHYALAKPALLAGKNVFVEWPLAANTTQAKELAHLAQTHGCKTIVGAQTRASPLLLKIKALVSSGTIGKVLSSTVISSFGGIPHGRWPLGAEYYLDLHSGGNQFTIFFGHFLESFTRVLGDFRSVDASTLRTDYPNNVFVDATGTVVREDVIKTSPDHIQLQGTLEGGASVSIVYYTAPGKSIDDTGRRWVITGTEGQIEITDKEMQWQMGPPGTRLRLKLRHEDEVQEIDFQNGDEEDVIKEVNFPGTNTARLYEAFVEGREERYADFERAVKIHELLDLIREKAGW